MLRTAVIGVGSMGANHARLFNELSDLKYVVDTNKSRAKMIGNHYGVEYLSDYRKLLDKDLDAISVVVPTKFHHKVAMDLLEQGLNLLIEKPITYDLHEAREIVDKAEGNGCTLCVGHVERYNPIIKFAKEATIRGEFGKVISMNSRRVSSYPSRVTDIGVIMDLAIHDIDIQKYLADSNITSVMTLAGSTGGSNHEDHANILLEFENGIVGHMEINWLTPIKIRTLNMTCSNKVATIQYIEQTCKISSSKIIEFDMLDSFMFPQEVSERTVHLKKEEPLKREIQDFLEAVKTMKSPLVNGHDGIEAVTVAQAAIDSYRKKTRIEIPI